MYDLTANSSICQSASINPRPSTTGVTDHAGGLLSSGHLDYLAVTFPQNTPFDRLLPGGISPNFELTGRGRYGYRTAHRNSIGVQVMADGDARQGVHVILSGEPLEALRQVGITDRQMCWHVLSSGGKVARLDVAIDIYGGRLRPVDLEAAFDGGKLKTPAHQGKRWYGKNVARPDDMFAVGSRLSDRYLRFYLKESEDEMGKKQQFMRVELEMKKGNATAVNAVLATSEQTRAVINALIADYVSWKDSEEWTAVLAGHDVVLPTLGRRATDWERWMLAQVIPSIVREQHERPNDNVIHWVVEQYIRMLGGPTVD